MTDGGAVAGPATDVVSAPLLELVQEGRNQFYVKNCVEMNLAGRGIDRLGGFERLTNLEVLFANDNQIRHISHLDHNIRLRELYLHNNRVTTLRGSLRHFQFLNVLDLTNNNLRDLQKVLVALEHFRFLHHLELKGNPCCEEADYRATVIHRLPSLEVLDLHVVTEAERRKAKMIAGALGMGGGDTVQATLAFGLRAPPRPALVRVLPGTPSPLGLDMARELKAIQARESRMAVAREEALFASPLAQSRAWAPGAESLPLPLPLDAMPRPPPYNGPGPKPYFEEPDIPAAAPQPRGVRGVRPPRVKDYYATFSLRRAAVTPVAPEEVAAAAATTPWKLDARRIAAAMTASRQSAQQATVERVVVHI